MRIDRLLGITIYLLNREKVSARVLADRFEVSQRTIQRDIEALNLAGIPIASTCGACGGYEILDSFKLERQLADGKDYSFILTALKGLSTAYDNPGIEATLEKIKAAIGDKPLSANIILDFSVLREGEHIQEKLSLLEEAIIHKTVISFDYTTSSGLLSSRTVEPIILTYRWYSWYLLAFCTDKKDYRLFKLVRMSGLTVTNKQFSHSHESADILLKRQDGVNNRKYLDIRLRCKGKVKMQALEYLNGKIEEEYENGDFILKLHLPEDEHLWFATLLALGNNAVVLEPDSLKQRLCEKAKEILDTYR
jgi:predicted DNA-binding transcriptional regulator YafY